MSTPILNGTPERHPRACLGYKKNKENSLYKGNEKNSGHKENKKNSGHKGKGKGKNSDSTGRFGSGKRSSYSDKAVVMHS